MRKLNGKGKKSFSKAMNRFNNISSGVESFKKKRQRTRIMNSLISGENIHDAQFLKKKLAHQSNENFKFSHESLTLENFEDDVFIEKELDEDLEVR